MGITFAKWRGIVPLGGMSRNTAYNNLTDEFVAFVTEEAQGFSCLVTVLVQGLVAIIGNTRVWARIIFHWQEKSNFKNQKSRTSKRWQDSRGGTYRHILDCDHSIWGCRCLFHGRRSDWVLPAGNPGCRRNEPAFRQQSRFQGAPSALRSPPPQDPDTVGL